MSIAQSILPEFDHEIATTRKLLERTPADQAAWKPHDKSMSLGRLAMHLGEIPGWGTATLTQTELDMSPPGGSAYKAPTFDSVDSVLASFDSNAASARSALLAASDEEMMAAWTLKNAGHAIFTMPRAVVFRSFVLSHLIHHRGQYSVYLRMTGVPVPSIYGPSADES